MRDTIKLLQAELFGDPDTAAFCVLDGAAIKDLRMKLHEWKPDHVCLWLGDLEPDMAEVAPYLVQLDPHNAFTAWVLEGWGRSWGIFALCPPDLRKMRQHFRAFLNVHDSEGRPLKFRYYDPRVLRVFLPTCLPDELRIIFGPVERYVMEGEEDDSLLTFRFDGAELKPEEKALKAS